MQDITLDFLKEAKQLCLSYGDTCTSLSAKQLTCPHRIETADRCKLITLQRELTLDPYVYPINPNRWTQEQIDIILKKYLIHLIEK